MDSSLIRTIEQCRVCGSYDLLPILSLGSLYFSDFVDRDDSQGIRAPLDVVLCDQENGGCGLLQLKHSLSPDVMYRQYWYRSGVNKTMTDALHGIARTAERIVNIQPGDYVIDIGANDGTLLRGYAVSGLKLVGYEPAKNLREYNREGTTLIIEDFFNATAWMKQFGGAKAKAITAIAMFYDLDDPNAFVADVKSCLDSEGIFIIQMNYLPLMLSQTAFDNISHEHLEYYSLQSLEFLLSRHNLQVRDVELNSVNGGSFRIYITHSETGNSLRFTDGADQRVQRMRELEKALGLQNRSTYQAFVDRIHTIRDKTKFCVQNAVTSGKKVYVYGASTRGNTLLQYFGLDAKLLTAAAERNPVKWGKRTIGTNIPIVSEEEARAARPEYMLVLPWQFIDEFVERENAYLASGGTFIVPLPEFRLISHAVSAATAPRQ